MPDQDTVRELHEDNDTPLASDEGIQRTDKDTPFQGEGSTGNAVHQGVRVDGDANDDPKSGGTPVHPAPSEDRPRS